jgi:hypothetical protein
LGEDWSGNSEDEGFTLFEGSASVDSSGQYHLHFNAESGMPYGPGLNPPIEDQINVTLDKNGNLAPNGISGWHTAFPGFEIWDYQGAGDQSLLYTWDPHNNFDKAWRSHADYGPLFPGLGLFTKVGVKGNVRGLLGHTAYW